jgi:hypothetical protein
VSLVALLGLANANATWRQAKVCLRPLTIEARSEPPGRLPLQHRVPIRGAGSRLRNSSLASADQIALGLFQSQVGRQFHERTRFPGVPLSLAAPATSYEPLYVITTVVVADIARRRNSGMLATPDLFGLSQNPLGAYRLPQALTTVEPAPSPKRPFEGSGEVILSSALADFRIISFCLAAT